MKRLSFILFFCVFSAQAEVVLTTLPELKWVAEKIAPKQFKITSLLNGHEDPHFLDATPSLVLKMAKADLIILNGLELEIGWLPKVIQMAGNSKIQLNGKGYCNASKKIKKAQVVQNYNRSMGHLHPMGNPHYTLSVAQFMLAAATIKNCLTQIKPAKEKVFAKNLKQVLKDLSLLEKKLKKKMKPLQKFNFMTYHQEFIYFLNDYKLSSKGTIEKIPGVLPSASFLYTLSKKAAKDQVKLVLAAQTNPDKYLSKFKEMTKIPYVKLPMHMNESFKDYQSFQNFITDEILKNVNVK